MISLQPFVSEIEDIPPGGTIRVDHTDCGAGEDTRRRLYISRPIADPTKVLAYCHNCQQSGLLTQGSYQTYRDTRHQAGPVSTLTTSDDIVEPPNLVFKVNDWPIAAQAWFFKTLMTHQEAALYRIGHDPATNRVYLPRYALTTGTGPRLGELIGYQLRLVDGEGPKYLTCAKTDSKGYSVMHSNGALRKACVIVEDLVSAIHILRAYKDEDMAVVVNYGTKVDLEALHFMSHFEKCAVWLDNDNPHVMEQAETMERTLKLLGCKSVIKTTVVKDPKGYDTAQIRTILWTT